MSELFRLFCNRVGLSNNKELTFESLSSLLEHTAMHIPFENLCIIEKRTNPLSIEYLIEKILIRREGGLCYELNPLLHHILVDQGFDAELTRGVVFNQAAGAYGTHGRTHVAILLHHNEQTYLVDTGFGGNLPLKPVPLSGDVVTSTNGAFKVTKTATAHGDYVLEMKLKYKDSHWRIGYVFDSKQVVQDLSELDEIQTIIIKNPESSFNKQPLITKLTNRGSITLTSSSFTQWIDGKMIKERIDHSTYKQYLSQYFEMGS